ncbi:hypothetical protein HS7_10570 [Sulfolobales archaeon HS-7]|nr:hypothetical protein HS7_10570 [Sulfolobales archaeon HS-7]
MPKKFIYILNVTHVMKVGNYILGLVVMFLMVATLLSVPAGATLEFLQNYNKPVLTPAETNLYFPYVSVLNEYWFYTSNTQIFYSLLSGQVQFAGLVHTAQIYQAMKDPSIYVYDGPTYSYFYFAFNLKEYPMNNTYFRWAVSSVLNYQLVEEEAWANGLKGIALPYELDPTLYSSYYNPQMATIYAQHESYNLTRAMMYLKDAGLVYNNATNTWDYPNGTPVVIQILTPPNAPPLDEASKILVDGAHSIGLDLQVECVPFSTEVQLVDEQNFQIDNLGVDISAIAPTCLQALYGYPINFLETSIGVYNKTLNTVLDQAATASTVNQSIVYTKEAEVMLQYELPAIIFGWGNSISGSYLPGFDGYTGTATQGVWLTDVHHTGLSNGTYVWGLTPETGAPTTYDIYTVTTACEFDGLDDNPATPTVYDTALVTPPGNPLGLEPWAAYNYTIQSGLNETIPGTNVLLVDGQEITFYFNHNITFFDGMPLTALSLNFSLWYLDTGGFSSNPYNPSQDTVYIGNYYGKPVYVNYTAESIYSSIEWFGDLPGLAYSYVPANNPYVIHIFFNDSAFTNIYKVSGIPLMPCFIFENIPPQELGQDVYSVSHHGQVIGSGPVYMYQWNTTYGLSLVRNPSYFKFNALANSFNVSPGTDYTLMVNITQIYASPAYINGKPTVPEPFVPIANATGYVAVIPYGSTTPVETVPLTQVSGSMYKAVIPTASLSTGATYELMVNATYVEPIVLNMSAMSNGSGLTTVPVTHYFYEYYAMNVVSPTVTPPPTTTTTTTPVTTTTTPTTTTIAPPPSPPPSQPVTATVSQVTTITSGVSLAVYASVGIEALVVIVGVAVLFLVKR